MMTNNFSSEPGSESYAYSTMTRIRMLEIQVDILILKQLSLITDEELVSLMKMIKSPDLQNYILAESIVKNLLKKVDDEHTRKA